MTKLQLQKTAADVAFATAAQTLPQTDAAISAKASELELNDQQYQQFRNDVAFFRAPFVRARQADDLAAARAKATAATAAPNAA